MTQGHTITLYRNRSKIFNQQSKNTVAFNVIFPTIITSNHTSRIKKFLRSIHLNKNDIAHFQKTLQDALATGGISYNTKPNVIQESLSNGIVFYTYKYFQEYDTKLKPYDIHYVNIGIDIETITTILNHFGPNLFVRQVFEPHKSLEKDIGFQISVSVL